ncbi:hypothetical protein L3049_16375 [Labilibaculum sp. DW002]|uniref:DUF4468 domain-containing protein n=1 Tax=Paralabilibaculum antarcticum TaxID=2912572 RepID=A0ABT5VVX1_9BACT|nr:hypothetical protein [Labilibaculum sp. DW002]MDE5419571.1 hypothetical protein [Labilibaculum sp. DW002]
MLYNKTYNLTFIVLTTFCLIFFTGCASKKEISSETPKPINRNNPNIETAEKSFLIKDLLIESKIEFVKFDWILSENVIKDSKTEFDIQVDYSDSLIKYFDVIEYSPVNKDYKKITIFEYETESSKLILLNKRLTLISGISYDSNIDLDKELKYNNELTIDFYNKLIDEIISNL